MSETRQQLQSKLTKMQKELAETKTRVVELETLLSEGQSNLDAETQHQRAAEHIRKLYRTLGVLSDINQVIVRIHHLPTLFEKACGIAVEKGALRMAWIGLIEPETKRISPVAHAGVSDGYLEKLEITLREGSVIQHPLATSLRAGERWICNDLENDAQMLPWRENALQLGYRASGAWPLTVSGEVRGLLNLYAGEPDFFNSEELKLLDEMAMDISFAMELSEQDEQRRRAETAVKRYGQRMEILHQIDRGLIQGESIQDLVDVTVQHLRTLIACQRADVMLLDETHNDAFVFSVGLDRDTTLGKGVHVPIPPDVFEGYDARYVRIFDDIRLFQETRPRAKRLVDEGLLSALSVILMDRERPVGVLGLFADAVGFFTPDHVEIAVEVASQLAIAIRQLNLSEELARHAAELEQRVVERTAELQAAKERVEGILNNSPDGILLVHPDLKIQQVNPSFNSLFLCEQDDYFGKSLASLVRPEDIDLITKTILAGVAEHQGRNIEIHALRKDGKVFDAELGIRHIKDGGLVCSIRDITERKAQEHQLRYYASLQESVVDSVIATDMEFRIQTWNRGAERTYGWAADEAIGKVAPELLQIRHPPSQDSTAARQRFNEQGYLQQETIQRRKDGNDIYVLGSASLLSDENGTPVGIISVNRDITERKAMERQLRYHASLQENVSDAVIVTDAEFRIQSWNRAAERIYGWRAEEVVHRATAEVLGTQYASSDEFKQVLQLFREQGWWQGEVVQRHKDGSVRYILGSVTLIKDENGIPVSVVSVNHDITERKHVEEAMNAKLEEEREFQNYLKALHDISIELAQIDQLDEFYRRTVEFGLQRLGIERLSLFVYDKENDMAVGTYGTDSGGKPVDEHHLRFTPSPDGIMGLALRHAERFYVDENVRLSGSHEETLGTGWNAAAILWNGTQSLGWLVADNLLSHTPPSKPILEALSLYALSVGTLLARKHSEVALRESEARYRLLAENVSDVMVKISPAGIRTLVTPSIYALTGYTPEELVGRPAFDIVHPDDLNNSQVAVMQAVSSPVASFSVIQRIHHKAGHYVWVEVKTSIVRDPGTGGVVELLGVIRDITERKQTEEVLTAKLEEDREFQRYLKGVHDITIELTQVDDLDTFYRRAVELGLERLGFERLAMFLYDEQNGAALGTYGTDTQGTIVDERQLKFIPEPNGIMVRAFGKTERFYIDENVPLYKNREPVGVGWNAAAVLWNGTRSLGWLVADNLLHQSRPSKPLLDTLALYALTLGTLLRRKQTQAALRESEERFRQIAENFDQVLFIRSGDDRKMLFINPRYELLWGRSRQSVYDNPDSFLDAVHPDDREHVFQELATKRYVEEGLADFEYRITPPDQSIHWVRARTFPIKNDEGVILRRAGIVEDITERKQSEEALRASEARFRSFFEQPLIGMAVTSPDRGVLLVNDKLCELFDYSRAELLQMNWANITHQDDLAADIEQFERVLAGAIDGYSIDKRFIRRDGRVIHTIMTCRCVRDSERKVEHFFALVQDISERKQAEEALRESEEKFRLLMDAAPVAIVITNAEGHITLINHQTETLLGYSRAELVGQSVDILVPDSLRKGHAANRTSYLAAPRIRQMGSGLELFARRKDGSELPVEIELSYVQTQTGLLVMSFILDVTERRENASALQQQRAFLRNVIDFSPSMIFVKDYNARFVLVNQLVAQMYNTTPEALIGKSDADFNPSLAEVENFLEGDRQVIASGKPLFLEEPITNFAGETHWLQTTKVPIISTDGKSKVVLGVSTDITERKQAENALREQHEFLELVINSLPELIAVRDPAGRYTLVNKREADIHGSTPSAMLGKTTADFNPNQAEVDFFIQKDREALDTGQPIFIPEETVFGRFYQTNKIPLKNRDGKFDRLLVVASDITERKNAEDALRQAFEKEKELSELKSRFVSMASHEFRTPLATILALTETLSAYRQKMADDQIEQRLGKIRDQVSHLKDIMEDVLQLARLQARRAGFNPVRTNLDAVCRSILDEFQSRPDITHRLIYTCEDPVREVTLDKKLIRQIISNLVSNAIKYSPPDKEITVSLEFPDDALVLKVRDSGIGIPEADLKYLFEPFHRAANVGTISGTGLGLVITKESVELHGGTITVETQVGVGTTFTVKIPIAV